MTWRVDTIHFRRGPVSPGRDDAAASEGDYIYPGDPTLCRTSFISLLGNVQEITVVAEEERCSSDIREMG